MRSTCKIQVTPNCYPSFPPDGSPSACFSRVPILQSFNKFCACSVGAFLCLFIRHLPSLSVYQHENTLVHTLTFIFLAIFLAILHGILLLSDLIQESTAMALSLTSRSCSQRCCQATGKVTLLFSILSSIHNFIHNTLVKIR